MFESVGIPDTEYAFDNKRLEITRLKVAVSKIHWWKGLNPNADLSDPTAVGAQDCQDLLTE